MRSAPALPLLLAVASLACTGPAPAARAAATTSQPPAAGGGAIVAEVAGEAVTRAELEQRAQGRLTRLKQEEYEILEQVLQELVADKLLAREAARRGVTTEALLAQEVTAKVPAPTAEQVEATYVQFQSRLQGKPREQVLPEIERYLRDRVQGERRQAFVALLRQSAGVNVSLEPPRTAVTVPADAPTHGPAAAPVTIVAFADYQCPYCRRAQGVMDALLARYEGKIRFVHRDFPLDGHPRAFNASRATHCAAEQGKFWSFHRNLLVESGDLSDADLARRAGSFGLDAAKFSTCIASDRFDATIRQGLEDGARAGVTGTPAFFINGRMISGAQPLEHFVAIVEAELARKS